MKVLLNDQAEQFLENMFYSVNETTAKDVGGVFPTGRLFTWFRFSEDGEFDTGEENNFNEAFQKIKSNETFIGEF